MYKFHFAGGPDGARLTIESESNTQVLALDADDVGRLAKCGMAARRASRRRERDIPPIGLVVVMYDDEGETQRCRTVAACMLNTGPDTIRDLRMELDFEFSPYRVRCEPYPEGRRWPLAEDPREARRLLRARVGSVPHWSTLWTHRPGRVLGRREAWLAGEPLFELRWDRKAFRMRIRPPDQVDKNLLEEYDEFCLPVGVPEDGVFPLLHDGEVIIGCRCRSPARGDNEEQRRETALRVYREWYDSLGLRPGQAFRCAGAASDDLVIVDTPPIAVDGINVTGPRGRRVLTWPEFAGATKIDQVDLAAVAPADQKTG